MNIPLLRQVLANDRAASQATIEARRITAKTFSTHPTESMNPSLPSLSHRAYQGSLHSSPAQGLDSIGSPNECVGRQSQVEQQLCVLEQEINDNHGLISELYDRLSPVILLRDQKAEGDQAEDVQIVQLADRIRNAFRNERNNNIALRALLAAIEL